jgi:outer membrane receptor protein involved in Fe transport
MDRKLLTSAICAALALSTATIARAQDAPQDTQDAAQASTSADDATDLDTIVVTGSRIPRTQLESASPVLTITAAEIQKQGFRNVSDVLRAQPLSTGSVADNQYAGSFTATATTISLLGLSPSFTLILLDGRPLADYPLLYNGQSNFTDLTSIPTAMVERIDILPGNQSSIYGSAAIAGVVNIILKKHIDGMQLDMRAGGYSDGGGENQRLQLTGGNQFGDLDLTWGLQYSHQDPIYQRQRDFTDSTNDNPDPNQRFGSRTMIIRDYFITGQYEDPGDQCEKISFLYGGTTERDFRPGLGYYCGSRAQPSYATLLNEEKGLSGYLNGTFRLNDNADLYATVLVGRNEAVNDTGSHFWVPNYNDPAHQNLVWNIDENTLELFQHIFAPEEQGRDGGYYTAKSQSYSAAFGIKGTFGDSDWDYDAYYNRSGYKVTSNQLWPLVDEMDAFFRDQFLGPQDGFDPYGYGYPAFHPDKDAFYGAITPDQFRAFSGTIHNVSKTWTQNLNVQVVNAKLFDLPAGPVGVAGVLQVGNQFWDNPIDPRVGGGAFFGVNGTSGRGKRANQAIGAEFTVPLMKSLLADVSVRYDAYQNIDAGSDSKPTYKVGLEFRPIDTLLIRGNYATAFRAPDMGYVFTGGNGFFSFETDFYKCEIDPTNCNLYSGVSVEGNQIGNPDLKSINARSFGFGIVWSPSSDFDLRADYYNIKIEDEVVPQSTTQTLFDENECRQGRLDITSARCVDALSRVVRSPVNPANPLISENVTNIIVKPINIASENVSGITAGGNYRFETGIGKFNVGLDYNVTLKHETRTFPDQPVYDVFSTGQALTAEFKSILTGDLGWEKGRWSANLHGIRYGSLPNYAKQFTGDPANPYVTSNGVGPGNVKPWILYNLSVDFEATPSSTISLIVNNLRNSEPPHDASYDGINGFAPPYYNIFAYNGYGRSYWVEYKVNFGADK